MTRRKVTAKLIKSNESIQKSKTSNNAQDTKESNATRADGIIGRPYPIDELQALTEKSTILQQCIEAYKRNIVGFGASPSYLIDKDEDTEMIAEWNKISQFLRYFNLDNSFEDVFAELIGDREETGNAYLEVLRDGTGLPVGGDRIDPSTMFITKLTEPVDVTYYQEGKKLTRKRRFRRFVQEVGTAKVYYKEFGDPRKMDSRTGDFVEGIEEQYEATEILHLKIGNKTYGIPRWIGQLIHMYGARKAEELNFRYFSQGRHTPMAILLHNAELSEESEQALVEYANSVEGVDNSHKFLLIEAEGLSEGILEDEKKNAKVEIKSLADMLQQDALFLEYDEASRLKVQSAFRLPDIYVGRSKDYNRATSDTARAITEEQVFEPERNSLEWLLNNRLLNEYQLKFTGVNFRKPEISNIEELVAVIDAGNKVGAIAPNDIRDVIGKVLGKDLEDLEGDEYNIPLAFRKTEHIATPSQTAQIDSNQTIEKSMNNDIISVLKDLRDIIEEMSESDE